jgi:sugar/nucleoside kinase (ribokinase family)
VLFAKCGEDDRARYQRRLATLGLPATLAVGGATTSFSFTYDGDGRRTMRVETIGEPWQTHEPQGTLLQRVEWLHVAPLLRSDFDAAALERLGLGRRLMLDAQGLVRVPAVGPLRLDANYDPDLLRHVAILKVAEEEARVLVGDTEPESLAELGVPEIVLTLGAAGSTVIVRGHAEHVPARPADGGTDPTGAGDSFAAAYLAARADGHAPASAARRATALVAALLMSR